VVQSLVKCRPNHMVRICTSSGKVRRPTKWPMRPVYQLVSSYAGEVVNAAAAKSGGLAGLCTLVEPYKDQLAFGVVLCDSADLVHLGDKLAAAPLLSL